jgi:hypothetical protein
MDLIWTTGNKRKPNCDPATKKRSLFPGGPAVSGFSRPAYTSAWGTVELSPKCLLLLARVNLSDRGAAHAVGRPIGALDRFRE